MKKKLACLILFWNIGIGTLMACPVCERNQPKILRGIVHGQGPENQWDYPIIVAVTILVLMTAWLLYALENITKNISKERF